MSLKSDPAQPSPQALDTKRARTKAHNRQAILDGAREVFAELGFGATTVRDIIRRTNLASGTFYNYFTSKEDVFQALLDESALEVRPRLKEQRKRAKTFEEFVEGTFRTFFDYLVTDRTTFAVLRRNAGALRMRMNTPEMVAGFDELRNDIEQAVSNGLIPDVDTDYLTFAVIGIAFEVGDRMLMRDPPDPDGAARFATALVLSGLGGLPRAEEGESGAG